MIILYVLLSGAVLSACVLCGRKLYNSRYDKVDPRLEATWQAMQAANRLNFAYWQAHEAMRREANR